MVQVENILKLKVKEIKEGVETVVEICRYDDGIEDALDNKHGEACVDNTGDDKCTCDTTEENPTTCEVFRLKITATWDGPQPEWSD